MVINLLAGVLTRVMPPDETAGTRPDQTVMTGVMTGYATDYSAFETSFGLSRATTQNICGDDHRRCINETDFMRTLLLVDLSATRTNSRTSARIRLFASG